MAHEMADAPGQWLDEMRQIVSFVETETGLRSRWNGSISLLEDLPMQALRGRRVLAEKRWNCGILVHESLCDNPLRWRSLLHEAMHSVSVGMNEEDYRRFRGWEEGIVEWLQRQWRPALLHSLGVNVLEEAFAAYEQAWLFRGYLEALQILQEACGWEPEAFYRDLLRTPLAQRPATVRGWGTGSDFLPLFAHTLGKLR